MNDLDQETSEAPVASGKAIASMVLGIISIPAACTGPFTFLLAGPGLILGLMSKSSGSRGFAITGIVTSVIGMLLGLIRTAGILFSVLLPMLVHEGPPQEMPEWVIEPAAEEEDD